MKGMIRIYFEEVLLMVYQSSYNINKIYRIHECLNPPLSRETVGVFERCRNKMDEIDVELIDILNDEKGKKTIKDFIDSLAGPQHDTSFGEDLNTVEKREYRMEKLVSLVEEYIKLGADDVFLKTVGYKHLAVGFNRF